MHSVAEQWRDVKGFEGFYQVSDMGNVKSLSRLVGARGGKLRRKTGKVLKVYCTKHGYPVVSLSRPGLPRASVRFSHALVCEAFVGPRPPGMEVHHKNADRADARLENLEYVTHKENIKHAADAGRMGQCRGNAHPRTKLTDAAVELIRSSRLSDMSDVQIAAVFGMSSCHIGQVRSGEKRTKVAAQFNEAPSAAFSS